MVQGAEVRSLPKEGTLVETRPTGQHVGVVVKVARIHFTVLWCSQKLNTYTLRTFGQLTVIG